MLTTKKYTLPALPERTVVRIPIGGKINSFGALMKEIKKNGVPTTARLTFMTTSHGRAARLVYPTNIAA